MPEQTPNPVTLLELILLVPAGYKMIIGHSTDKYGSVIRFELINPANFTAYISFTKELLEQGYGADMLIRESFTEMLNKLA